MNCANHPDRERSAFCQNCGKPLCTECIRTLGNSVLCEPCFAIPSAEPVASSAGVYPPPTSAGANPGLAALLGFIPGVGAMYNGQYAKGVVHLIVFALLVSLSDQNGIFGLFIAGWVFYMIIEAYHTARARREGTPLPNPFGLNDLGERLGFGRSWPPSGPATTTPPGPATAPPPGPAPGTQGAPYTYDYNYAYVPPVSSWGAPQQGYGVPPVPQTAPPIPPGRQHVPMGAIWLIGLGVLFLLGNTGLFWIRGRFVAPLLLIAVAVWIFVRQMTAGGHGIENDGTPAYSARLNRAVVSSMWLGGTGIIWLLDVLGVLPWSRSWPLYLILAGVAMVLRRTFGNRMYPGPYGYPPYPGSPVPPAAPPPAAPGTGIVATSLEHRPGEER